MATNTTNYSFKKPDESDFYDVQDQNGNWDKADEALKSLDTPTFEDYTGSTPVPAANTAIDGIKSKTKLSALMSNIKAAFKGACLIGHIVNNCVTNNPNLPLSAAQGKVLMDLYTQLNGERIKKLNFISIQAGQEDQIYSLYHGEYDTVVGGWMSYVALCTTQNFMILGYETASGYGVQLRLQHGGGVAAMTARKKRSGTWGEWGENPVG